MTEKNSEYIHTPYSLTFHCTREWLEDTVFFDDILKQYEVEMEISKIECEDILRERLFIELRPKTKGSSDEQKQDV